MYIFKPFLVILFILSKLTFHHQISISVPIGNFLAALPAFFKSFLEASVPQT